MNILSKKSVIAIVIGVVVSLVLFVITTKSPYVFAIGLAISIILSEANSFKNGAIHGVFTAVPISLYLIISNSIVGVLRDNFWVGFLNAVLLIGFGGLYGGVLAWIGRNIREDHNSFN